MPELASMLLRKSLASTRGRGSSCAACRRTPLPGEGLHELDSGRVLCDLCLSQVPEEKRRPVKSERVHASERRLAVVPKAA
jgi:hypothetical protein